MRYPIPMAVALATLAGAGAADAQGACGARDTILGVLETQQGQTVRGVGLGADQRILEWHANEETGEWTVTLTGPNGVTCVMAVGEAFAGFGAPIPGEDA